VRPIRQRLARIATVALMLLTLLVTSSSAVLGWDGDGPALPTDGPSLPLDDQSVDDGGVIAP